MQSDGEGYPRAGRPLTIVVSLGPNSQSLHLTRGRWVGGGLCDRPRQASAGEFIEQRACFGVMRLRRKRSCGVASAQVSWALPFPIDELIVDFCCRARRLVIELDGSQHAYATGVINGTQATPT